MRLMKKIVVEKKLILLTGLHIGGSDVTARIGAIDSPVIRDGFGRIYIPGSSIKGKIRSLVEKSLNSYGLAYEWRKNNPRENKVSDELAKEGWKIVGNSLIHDCGNHDCKVCGVFGSAGSDKKLEGKVIFYDAYPEVYYNEDGTLNDDANIETENKGENTIDRVTSEATPRFFERVPAGTVFRFTYVINVYNEEEEEELEKRMEDYLKLLEHDYLGGSGTRGYGRVKFEHLSKKVIEISPEKIEIKEAE